MQKPARKLTRCAVYTRKSTEHNLDLEFNSLDAQRESCEAYIKSQAHEGWRLIPEYFDDGAFSGASLERPALQQLLAEVRSGKVDNIVVYKVDRLTRSLTDFAKLVELFDQNSVSFVSVTQSFNTTSSMGRLTLNVLLSFAQFEREVIGERVRDKIAASKAKGMWMGGFAPLGYTNIGKKLVIVPQEAEVVRDIYRRYLAAGSIGALAEDLTREGIRSRPRPYTEQNSSLGVHYGVGHLGYLLKNRIYVGEVRHRGAVYDGEHAPIMDRVTFDEVQEKLAASAVNRQLRLRASPSILTGHIFDDRGNRMTPTHANKQGARYRYYVSHALLQKRREHVGNVARVPAVQIETIVSDALLNRFGSGEDEAAHSASHMQRLIERYLERVTVRPDAIEVALKEEPSQADHGVSETLHPRRLNIAQTMTITIPWAPPSVSKAKGILYASQRTTVDRHANREAMLLAIAKARRCVRDLAAGRTASFAETAKQERLNERHVRNLANLAFVSPELIESIIQHTAPRSFTVTRFATDLPFSWAKQRLALQAGAKPRAKGGASGLIT